MNEAEVDKMKAHQVQIQERLESEKSRQRKLQDTLYDRESALKISEGDFEARRLDLDAVYIQINSFNGEQQVMLGEIEAL